MTDTTYITDDEIEAAITGHDGPVDHPKTVTVEQMRDALDWLQQSMEEVWKDLMSNVREGEMQVVHEDSDVVVFATGEQSVPSRDLREYYDGELGERGGKVADAIHHQLARDRCDYDWGYEYPLVVRKPESFDAGQAYVEAIVNGLQQEGLSPGQAWAYYGVEIRGESMNRWGNLKGDHDHKNVSDALGKAREKLPR